MTPLRKKALVQVYACSPYRGSEAGVGWNWVAELSKYHEIHAIVREEIFSDEISQYLSSTGTDSLHFYFLPHTKMEKRLTKRKLTYYLGYQSWQKRALLLAKEIQNEVSIDLAHQLTYIGFRAPGFLWKLDVPFLWGPVGGLQNFPWELLSTLSIKGMMKEGLRNIINVAQLYFSPTVAAAANRASEIILATNHSRTFFQRKFANSPTNVIANIGTHGISTTTRDWKRHDQGGLRLLWSGNHDYHKALPLLLDALKTVDFEFQLRILGEGHLTEYWRKIAKRNGIENSCVFTGNLLHSEALLEYNWADIFVFTSMRDTLACVLLEALSAGLPILCIDHQGVSDVVSDETSFRVGVSRYSTMVSDINQHLNQIANNRAILEEKSNAARERAKTLSWAENGRLVAKLYESIGREGSRRS